MQLAKSRSKASCPPGSLASTIPLDNGGTADAVASTSLAKGKGSQGGGGGLLGPQQPHGPVIMHLAEYDSRVGWPTQRGQVGLQGRSPKAEMGPHEKTIRRRGWCSSSASTRKGATVGMAAEAVPDNYAKYDEAATKFDNDKGAVGITMAGHGVENAVLQRRTQASSSSGLRTKHWPTIGQRLCIHEDAIANKRHPLGLWLHKSAIKKKGMSHVQRIPCHICYSLDPYAPNNDHVECIEM